MGWNYRLSDIHAALGNSQLNKLTSTVAHRQRLRNRYLEELHSSSIQFQTINEETLSSNHLMIAQFETCVQRNQVYNALKAAGIGSSFHYIPVYRHPIHSSLGNPKDFPIMEHYYATALTLPLHVKLSESDIIKAANIVKEALIL
jgi:dTDP-4-amino-4,6-dideoxygalactose transaminase